MEGVITINDPRYPKLLREIGDPPKQLYFKGNWPASRQGGLADGKPARNVLRSDAGGAGIFENCLAVVGSRKMTTYGKQITDKLVSGIASSGITIISGFMYGIDAAAHKATVDVGARTIAVMPCGIELVHPEYQVKLYDQILENNGLIISEYNGNLLPTNWTYPRRNRIVAGLSKAIMVVEAGERSGSLITANFARKFKRKIFAVPGPLTSVLSKGICQLIKDGASVVTDVNDILKYYNLGNYSKNSSEIKNLNNLEQKIIGHLQKEPMEIDVLSRCLGIPVAEAGKILSFMELKGLVFVEGGKYYLK